MPLPTIISERTTMNRHQLLDCRRLLIATLVSASRDTLRPGMSLAVEAHSKPSDWQGCPRSFPGGVLSIKLHGASITVTHRLAHDKMTSAYAIDLISTLGICFMYHPRPSDPTLRLGDDNLNPPNCLPRIPVYSPTPSAVVIGCYAGQRRPSYLTTLTRWRVSTRGSRGIWSVGAC